MFLRSVDFNTLGTISGNQINWGPSGANVLLHTYFSQHLLPFCCLRGVGMGANQAQKPLSELQKLLLLLLYAIFK